MTAVMIDLETMGQGPTSAITSIGAVLFSPNSDWIGDHFHIHVSLANCLHNGMKADAETILWWLGQDDDARSTLKTGQADAAPLYVALEALRNFIPQGAEVWANGAAFDFAILKFAHERVCMPMPWDFLRERCLRTIKARYPSLAYERHGTHHNALHDAIHQVRLLQHINRSNPDQDA